MGEKKYVEKKMGKLMISITFTTLTIVWGSLDESSTSSIIRWWVEL